MAVSRKADAPYSSHRAKSSSSRASTRSAWAMVRLVGRNKDPVQEAYDYGCVLGAEKAPGGMVLAKIFQGREIGHCRILRGKRIFVRAFLSPNDGARQAVRKMHTPDGRAQGEGRLCVKKQAHCGRVRGVACLVHGVWYGSLSARQILLDQFLWAC